MARPKQPIPYSSEVRAEDTDRAIQTLLPRLIPDERKPYAVEFTGTCPRCGHEIQIREWLLTVSGASKMNDQQREALAARLDELGVDRSSGDETLDLTCACTGAHPKQPKDSSGCGARFRVNVTWP